MSAKKSASNEDNDKTIKCGRVRISGDEKMLIETLIYCLD